MTPEQKARRKIDGDLDAAGWKIQNPHELDLTVHLTQPFRARCLCYGAAVSRDGVDL